MTRRCSLCAINYPLSLKYEECPVCGGKTSPISNATPDEDWQEKVTGANVAAEYQTSPATKVAANRLGRFRNAGLDLGTAMEYAAAADKDVNLHLFERLRREGCSVEMAAQIVAPLP